MYQIRDGNRTLTFEGESIAFSSSETKDSVRWIEFELFRVKTGEFVIAREGVSLVYHLPTCELAEKYGLEEWDPEHALNEDSHPCEICRPSGPVPYVCPETSRYWARVCDSAEAVVATLYKRDQRGVRYITNVAARLMDEASKTDEAISEAYHNQTL